MKTSEPQPAKKTYQSSARERGMKTSEPQPAKKTYQSPRLVRYGEILEITKHITKTRRLDSGSGRQKT